MTCEEFEMELVSFETQAESDSVYAYIQAQSIDTWYHTSGVRINSYWKWSSTYLNYSNWAPGQPTETGTTYQACIAFLSGYFYDFPCIHSFNFICEDKVTC
ncbi:hypothetical protein B566_EDAN015169 [Ephemera danica]|nr:hypothetical protein B566_EDAN015169 [Ephemera danica]